MFACISIPYFAAAVERRAATDLSAIPLAIGGQPWEAKPIFAFSQEVAHHGVKAGMSLRLAHTLAPEARFLPATRPRYQQASGEIVDVLLDYSPRVEPQEMWHPLAAPGVQFTVDGRTLPSRYFLDFEGLPAAESVELARTLGRFLRDETRFAPAIGLAAGRFASQVAATLGRPSHARLVEPGSDAAFLAPQPIDFLPLEGETLRRLHLLGISTLGSLARLSRSALIAQFGPTIEPFHRLARGRPAVSSSATSRTAPLHQSAEHRFEPAVADRLVLEAVVRQLAERVVATITTGSMEAGSVYLAWETEDGRHDQSLVTLRRPTAAAQHLTTVWLDLLAAVIAGLREGATGEVSNGLMRLTLGSRDLLPAKARQMNLFDETEAETIKETWAAVRALMERHRAELFLRPILTDVDHPLPERRFQWQPLSHETAYDPALA